MSQQPPSPYGSPPPPPYPPGPYAPGTYPPAAGTSGTAITSLVLGILLCVPFVTGLGAVIFGLVGIRATRTPTPGLRGRGLAIAGVVLGAIGLVGWTAYFAVAGVAMYALFNGGMNPLIARGFFQQMSAGNTSGALAMCKTGTAAADVQATVDQMKGYGPMTAFTRTSTSVVNAQTTYAGTAQFQTGGTHPFDVVLDKGPGGVPQVQSWDLK